MAFVKGGQIVDEVKEIKRNKRQQKSWAKMWRWHEWGFDRGNTFEQIMRKIGEKLDDGQLEIVDDWTYIQVEIRQYNGRMIDVDLKCKTWDESTYYG